MKTFSLRQRLGLELNRKMMTERRKSHILRQLFWECTQRCNLSCRHCGSDCRQASSVPDMPAEDFLKVLDRDILPFISMDERHNLNIIITGGEPTVRADLEKVGLELYRRELPWGIVSNGLLLTDSRIDSLLAAGLHNITISLDGTEHTHDWMRGREGSFSKAIRAIRRLASEDSLNFDVVSCVNRRSLPELPLIKELLVDAGVSQWRLFTIFPSGRAAGVPEFDLDGAEIRRMLDFIVQTRKEGAIHASFCCEGFLGGYEGKVRDGFFGCEAGVSVASVLIDGSIGSCPSIRADYTQGNIYTDRFMDVWNNRFEAYRNRSWMRTGPCADCANWRWCEGNGMHLRDADGRLMHCHLLKK